MKVYNLFFKNIFLYKVTERPGILVSGSIMTTIYCNNGVNTKLKRKFVSGHIFGYIFFIMILSYGIGHVHRSFTVSVNFWRRPPNLSEAKSSL